MDPAVAAEWQPSETPVLALPGAIQVVYRDLGDKIELAITANANPVIYVDVNANDQVDAGDVSYAAGPNDTVCIQKLDQPTDVQCSAAVSQASVHTESADATRTTIWWIPKREVESNLGYADIVIQTFHGDTQRGEFYPMPGPFTKIYRLRFAEIYARSTAKETSGAAPDGSPSSGGVSESPSVAQISPLSEAIPSIASFDVDPVSNDPTAGFRIHWKVSGARTVDIVPDIGTVPPEGERLISPQMTTRYVLTAKSGTTQVTRETTIAVAPPAPPQIIAFSANPPEVQTGGMTRLSWNVGGRVTSVGISPLASELAAQGSRDITIVNTTDYLLTAEGPGGTVTGKVTVRIRPLEPPAITFEAVPAAVRPGDGVTLRWNVSGADRVSVDSGVGAVAPIGSVTLYPSSNAHYTITAAGQGGTATRDVSVTVSRGGLREGVLVWTGEVHGTQLVAIDHDHADFGHLEGALPGVACILQMTTGKNISIASAPGPRDNYERMVLRVKGNGTVRVVIDWVVQ